MTANDAAVPQVVFTDPEIAQVGLLPEAAKDRGINVRTVDLPISVGGSSLLADGFKGWSQFVIDDDRNVLVGVTFAGQDVAELLHAATVAIVGEVPLDRLWHAVPSYPTMSEVWLRFMEAAGL
jgi:dihydrolipoamide dehydrogenase